jgi:GGDEF domain-containing protein
MRQDIRCVLCGAEPGSLDEVRRSLAAWRLVCRSADLKEVAEGAASDDLLVVELRGDSSPPIVAALAAQRAAGGAALALCDPDDARAISLAASSGFDDLLAMPVDPIDLVRRVQTLANLSRLTAERRSRSLLFAAYREEPPTALPPHPTEGRRPRVVLLGRADDCQVRIAAALPPASVNYLEATPGLRSALESGGMDLLIVTQPGLLASTLDIVETAASEPPMLVAAHAGAPWALELPPQVDLLSLPAPMPLARVRLTLALRIVALRRWLREPPLGKAQGLLIDSLTGLYNQGAFLDYLRAASDDRALIGLEHDRLDWINQQSGYAAGNRILAQLGQSLRRRVRAHDFAAHLGGGRFAVAAAATSRPKLEQLAHRLQATVAENEPWQILAAAEYLPTRGTPAQRLSRLFGDLRRLRPAA